MRWGMAAVAALIGGLVLPAAADAGRAVTGPCRTVFCAGVSVDGSRVVFPFEEELTAGTGKLQIYERSAGKTRALLPSGLRHSVRLDEISADGAHVFVTTNLSLTPDDADGFGLDVFDVSAVGIALVSTGPLDPQAGGFVSFMGASPDGGRTFFDAFSPLTPDDRDTCPDLYQRFLGQTTLVAPEPDPPPSAPLCNSVRFGGVSADGSHLFFSSGDELEAGDERGEDIYQQVGSTFTRLTTYPESEGSCVEFVKFADSSSDGRTVLFTTDAGVLAEDADAAGDLYKRRPDGTFVLVSRSTDSGSPQCGFDGDRAIALSADGSTAIFETVSRLSPLDADSSNDLYSADDSGVIELLSTGPSDANVDGRANNILPEWLALASDDARRVVFETHHRLVAADRDTAIDVYLRAGGQTELISAGPLGKPVTSNAELLAFSGDGSTIVFTTKEPLAPKDLDRERDVYLRVSGQQRSALLSAETIAPRIRIALRGRLLEPPIAAIRLACPKVETSGPCHGRLSLRKGRRGKAIGSKAFRIARGQQKAVRVWLHGFLPGQVPGVVFARARGADKLGNRVTVTRRVLFKAAGQAREGR